MNKSSRDNTVLLLIDYQDGTIGISSSSPKEIVISRARALAKLAKAFHIPVVLTCSMEDQLGGILKDLQQLLPEEHDQRVKRTGIVDAWCDENFKKAVLQKAGGRKNVIMGGITNDVCVVWPAISMQKDGFNVQVVIDAGGSPTKIADHVAQKTWEMNGVRTTAISQIISEMVANWSAKENAVIMEIMGEEIFSLVGKVNA